MIRASSRRIRPIKSVPEKGEEKQEERKREESSERKKRRMKQDGVEKKTCTFYVT